jgi:hypothetical protein
MCMPKLEVQIYLRDTSNSSGFMFGSKIKNTSLYISVIQATHLVLCSVLQKATDLILCSVLKTKY